MSTVARRARFVLVLGTLLGLATSTLLAQSEAAGGHSGHRDVELAPSASRQAVEATAVFLQDRSDIAVIQLTGDYDRFQADGETNFGVRQLVGQEFYRSHSDDYDFLVVFPTFDYRLNLPGAPNTLGLNTVVRNDVEGIGTPLFDSSAAFGSAGRLQGYIDTAALSNWDTDPLKPRFSLLLGVLAHEVMHRWGVRVRFAKGDGSLSDELRGIDGSHWSFLVDPGRGTLMYGNDWRDDGGGSFTSLLPRRAYSALDLYLAGFLPPEEVPPGLLIEAPSVNAENLPSAGVEVDGSSTLVLIDDIVAAEGARSPGHLESQKRFRAAFVLLVRPEDEVTEKQIFGLTRVRSAFETHFSVLTGGRGILSIAPSSATATDPGSPDGVGGGPPRPSLSLADGLAWLRDEQAADGSWQDTPATRWRDTAVAASTLARIDSFFTGGAAARDFLASSEETSTDSTARRLLALRLLDENPEALIGDLLGAQNDDGGWGLDASYASDPLDTALALESLLGLADAASAERAVRFLVSVQNPDGSWGHAVGGTGRIPATASAVAVLRALDDEGVAPGSIVDRALVWLAAKQNPVDGGFGDSPSTAHDTALALSTFMASSALDRIDAGRATGYLGERQSLAGDWEGSVYTTALVLDILRRNDFANLRFLRAEAIPASAYDGEAVELHLEVINDGNQVSLETVLRVLDAETSTPIFDDVAVPELQPFERWTVTLSWDTTDWTGSHTLVVELDSQDLVEELSEADNVAELEVDVLEPSFEADLEIRAVEVVVDPGVIGELPLDVTVVAIVRNNGQSDAADVVVRLTGVRGEETLLLGEERLPLVAGRGQRQVVFAFELTLPGALDLAVVADPEGLLTEGSEDNNVATVALGSVDVLDLVVTPADVTLIGPAVLDETVVFDVTVRNRGTVDANNVPIEYLLDDGTFTVLESSVEQLPAGAEITRSIPWRVDREGDLSFLARVDPENLLPEIDDANNTARFDFSTGALAEPNLRLITDGLGIGQDPALEGAPLELTVLLENSGGVDLAGVEVGFYDGNPDQGGLEWGRVTLTDTLLSGSSREVTFVLPDLVGPQDRFVFAVADPDGDIVEFREDDNEAFRQVEVLRLPDLVITPASLSLAPRYPVEGVPVELTVEVTNAGEQAASDVVVEAWDGDPESGGSLVATTVLALASPASTTLATLEWIFASTGSDRLVVQVDPEDTVREGFETNNRASIGLGAGDADAFVTERYFSPNGDGVKDNTTFFYRVGAGQAATVEVIDSLDLVVRRDAVELGAEGSFLWDGRDDSGRLAADGDYALSVRDAAGVRLREATVTLDTDRASLLEAIGTPFENVLNLTCEASTVFGWAVPDSERHLYFEGRLEPVGAGIYRAGVDGSRAQLIVPDLQNNWVLSPDGSFLALKRRFNSPIDVLSGDGGGRTTLPGSDGLELLGFPGSSSEPLVLDDSAILRLPVDGVSEPVLLHQAADRVEPWPSGLSARGLQSPGLAPDGGALLFRVEGAGRTETLWLLDLESQNAVPLIGFDSALLRGAPSTAWLAGERSFAIADPGSEQVVVRDYSGSELEVYPFPPLPDELPLENNGSPLPSDFIALGGVSSLSAASNGRRLFLEVDYVVEHSECGSVAWPNWYLLDRATGSWRRLGSAPVRDNCFSFHIERALEVDRQSPTWQEVGVLHFADGLHELVRQLPLDLAGTDRRLRLRIRQTGGEAAWLDRVELRASGAPIEPAAVEWEQSPPPPDSEMGGARAFHETSVTFDWVVPAPVTRRPRLELAIRAAERASDGAARSVTSRAGRGSGPPSARARVERAGPIGFADDDRALVDLGRGYWIPGHPHLVLENRSSSESSFGFMVDADRLVEILPEWREFDASWVTGSGRRLLFESYDANRDRIELGIDNGCVGGGFDDDVFVLRTLANLTADLRVRQGTTGGLLIEGTASDAHFERYLLEFTTIDAPDQWRPIGAPVDRPVIDSQLTAWAPEEGGAYLIRLTVEDRAGNVRREVRQAGVAQTLSLANIEVSPRLISPNADGVRDQLAIQYDVLQPVHIDAQIFGPAGELVRVLSADEPSVGRGFGIAWDGRDDQGARVADGRYSVRLQGIEVFFEIDTQPPAIETRWALSLDPPVRARLELSARDDHLEQGEVGTVDEGPVPWVPVLTLEQTATPLPDVEESVGELLSLPRERFLGRDYRVEVRDEAGNVGRVQSGLVEERASLIGIAGEGVDPATGQLFTIEGIHAFGDHGFPCWNDDSLPPSPPRDDCFGRFPQTDEIRIRVGETLRRPIDRVFVEFRAFDQALPSAEDQLWVETELNRFFEVGSVLASPTIPVGSFDLVWNLAGVDRELMTVIRLRFVDVDGGVHRTPAFRLAPPGIGSLEFGGLLQSSETVDDSLLEAAGIEILEESMLYATETLPGVLVGATLFVTSEDDARYRTETAFEAFSITDGLIVFDAPTQSCSRYIVRVVGQTGEFIDPVSREIVGPLTITTRGNLNRSCLAIEIELPRVDYGACGEPGPYRGRWPLVVKPASLDGQGLKRLTLEVELADGTRQLLASINEPPAGEFETQVDISGLEEGRYPLIATLTNVADVSVEPLRDPTLIVDRSPPELEVTFPAPFQSVCGTFAPEGRIEDPMGFDFRVSAGTEEILPDGRLDVDGRLTSLGGRLVHPDATNPATLGGDGELTFRVEAVDGAGARACVERTVIVDSRVDLELTASARGVSPNADGRSDTLDLTVQSPEPGFVDVEVWPASGSICDPYTGELTTSSPPLVRVAQGLPAPSGVAVVKWDGRDLSGQPLESGYYNIGATFEDACGNRRRRGICALIVDLVPNDIDVAFPTENAQLPAVVEILGVIEEAPSPDTFGTLDLEYGLGTEPAQWFPINRLDAETLLSKAFDEDPIDFLTRWNVSDLTGPLTLRLRAEDEFGNRSEHRVPLEINIPLVLVGELEATPRLFSPNGDATLDSTSIRFALNRDLATTLRILDASESPVRTLVDQGLAAGASVRAWDGLVDNGSRVADGRYSVELVVNLVGGASQTERISVEVDATPPIVEITAPAEGGFAAPRGAIEGSVLDAHLESYRIELAPQGMPLVELSSGSVPVDGAPFASFPELADGPYRMLVTATDTVGSETVVERLFTVDGTPPVVELLAPEGGSFVSAVAGPLAIRGSVAEEHLAGWRLEFGSGAAPTSWQPVGAGDQLPLSADLANWNVGSVADGLYTLRLVAEDLAGQSAAATVAVTIDNTPPSTSITSPLDAARVGIAQGGGQPILGTASDENLTVFSLEVAPGVAGVASQWSAIGQGRESVVDGLLLDWRTTPSDGRYALRLAAYDRAGNRSDSVIGITVDTLPPSAPLALTARRDGARAARLDWRANEEEDLLGYHVYRDGERLTAQPIEAVSYLDAGLAEGTFEYTVTAIDRAGLESAGSNRAEITIDTAPPVARIDFPASGERVSGILTIEGTAHSEDDFREYRLRVELLGGGSTELRRSPASVLAAVLGEWSTLALAEGTAATLVLEAEDLNGNVASASVDLVVDNTPPAAPTGLVASASGRDVDVDWNANLEADLAGYLLYRDDRLVNAAGPVLGDVGAYAIEETSWLDQERPDGTFAYVVYAIDEAGNLSAPSTPAEATVEGRAPEAVVVVPEEGSEFDGPLYLLATSEDTDLDRVRFQVAEEGGAWVDLELDTETPWETNWNPGEAPYGPYRFRAVATDTSNKTDPSPAETVAVYRDLAPPPAVTQLTARVDGGEVALDWEPVEVADLDGYHVERVPMGLESGAPAGDWERITPAPITSTDRVDSGVVDSHWLYRVISVDSFGNEAAPSQEASAEVLTPVLEQPLTPTLAALGEPILGRGSLPGTRTIAGQIVRPSGPVPLGGETFEDGAFQIAPFALEPGVNRVEMSLVDAAGNRSKLGEVEVLRAARPAPPMGLVAGTAGFEVSLDWNASPEPEVVGYRVHRNGEPVLADLLSQDFDQLDASSRSSSVGLVADGDPSTYWLPLLEGEGIEGEWLAAIWSTPPTDRRVVSVELDWYEGFFFGQPTVFSPIDYDVEARFGSLWVPLARVRSSTEASVSLAMPWAYSTSEVRVLLRRARRLEVQPGDERLLVPRLAEMRVVERPITRASELLDTVADGRYRYWVTAIDQYGFESDPSEPATVDVGDVEAPEPPALTAVAEGREARLSWTASASPDVTAYEVRRDGVRLAVLDDPGALAYVDSNLANGSYAYTVLASDGAGNVSAPSNEETVLIDVALPGAPRALAVVTVEATALGLEWEPPLSGSAVAYRLYRSEVSGGPYDPVATTPDLSYRDSPRETGVTVYYVLAALDVAGNESPFSEQAEGTPQDLEPPAPPSLFWPASPTAPFATEEDRVSLLGLAEPDVRLQIERAGLPAGQATASSSSEVREVDSFSAFSLPELSADGRWLAAPGFETLVYDFDTGVGELLPVSSLALSFVADSSAPAGAAFVYLDFFNGVRRYSLVEGSDSLLTSVDGGQQLLGSPDGRRLALSGVVEGRAGIWVYDLESGEWTEAASDRFVFDARWAWSPASDALAFYDDGGPATITVWSVESGALRSAPEAALLSAPSWEGSSILFTVQGAGGQQVARWDLSTDTVERLTAPGIAPFPAGSPAGEGFVYLDDRGLVLRESGVDAENERVVAATGELGVFSGVAWRPGGVLIADFEQARRVRPAGSFRLDNVALAVGDNPFTAVAVDRSGNASESSAPVIVTLGADRFSDLAVDTAGLGVVPELPITGQSARITAQVENRGAALSAAADFTLVVVAPDGSQQLLLETSVPALVSGGVESFSVDLPIDQNGDYRLLASVDPANLVPESDETNNRAERRFAAASTAAPQIVISTERTEVEPGETVLGSVELVNAGDAFFGTLEVRVEDTEGFLVRDLVQDPDFELAFGENRDVPFEWDTSGIFTGPYIVRAELRNESGELAAQAEAELLLGGSFEIAATVVTDRALYTLGSTIEIAGRIEMASGSGLVEGLQAELTVVGPGGVVVATWTESLAPLLPGAVATLERGFDATGAAEGLYEARLRVLDPVGPGVAAELASASAPFALDASPAALVGALTPPASAVGVGDTLVVGYEVFNNGGTDLLAVPFSVSLRAGGGSAPLDQLSAVLDLPAGAAESGAASFGTAGLALETYTVLLQAELVENGVSRTVMLAALPVTLVDREPPEIEVRMPSAGGFLGLDTLATAVARDRLSGVERVELRVDGGDWLAAPSTSPSASEYGFAAVSALDLAEGAHILEAAAVDRRGNRAETDVVPFTVDTSPPTITVTGVVDGQQSTAPLTPFVSVDDPNLDTVSTTLNTGLFASGSTVAVTGGYRLAVVAVDLAGNRAEALVEFEILGSLTLDLEMAASEIEAGQTLAGTVSVASSGPVSGRLVVTVDSAGGSTVATTLDVAIDLASGNTGAWDVTWDSSGAAVGDYQVRARLTDDAGQLVAEAVAPVTVLPTLAATLALSTDRTSYLEGDPVIIVGEVTVTAGTSPLVGAQLRLRLYETAPAGEELVAEWLEAVPETAVGETTLVPSTWATRSVPQPEVRSYRVEGELLLGEALLATASTGFDVVEDFAPFSLILDPEEGSFHRAGVEVIVYAADQETAVARVEISLDSDGSWQEIDPDPSVETWWRTELALPDDGEYELRSRAFDDRENQSEISVVQFTVDRTPPEIVITGLSDGEVSEGPVTPVIDVIEPYLDTSTVTLDGVAYVSGTPVGDVGSHLLRVSARDLAGNASLLEIRFEIEHGGPGPHDPFIEITHPRDNSSNARGTTNVKGDTQPFAEVTVRVYYYDTDEWSRNYLDQANKQGRFDVKKVPLLYGRNRILATVAQDGEQASDEVTVTRKKGKLHCYLGAELLEDRNGNGLADPGDSLRFDLRVENLGEGTTEPLSVVLPLPESLRMIEGSVVSRAPMTYRGFGKDPKSGQVRAVFDIPTLSAGGEGWSSLELRIAPEVSSSETEIEVRATVSEEGGDSIESDDPSTPGEVDPTRIRIAILAIPTLGEWMAILLTLLLGALCLRRIRRQEQRV